MSFLFSGTPFQLDLGIVFGTNESLSGSTFEAQKRIARGIVNKYTISKDETLVGAIVYAEDAKVAFNFQNAADSETVVKKIRSLRRDNSGVDLLSALQIANGELFAPENGARKSSFKTLVVFIHPSQKIDAATEIVSKNLKAKGIKIIVIEVGSPVDKDDDRGIASSKKDTLGVSDLETIEEVIDKASELARPGKHVAYSCQS